MYNNVVLDCVTCVEKLNYKTKQAQNIGGISRLTAPIIILKNDQSKKTIKTALKNFNIQKRKNFSLIYFYKF